MRMTERPTPVSTRAGELSLPISAIARVTFAALLLALGVEIVRFAIGDLLNSIDPALAVVVDPTQTEARVAESRRLMDSNVSKVDEAAAGARDALSHNPLSPEALTLLGRASEQIGEKDRTSRLMTLATRINRRDLGSQLWLLNQELRGAQVNAALGRIDVLLRGQLDPVIEQLAPALPPILLQEPYRLGYVKLLRTNPPWRPVWFVDLLRRAEDPSALNYLFAELQAEDPGPTEQELTVFLNRLIEAGMFDEAHDAWLRTLPLERGEEASLLYNSQFHYQLTNLPFDWVIAPVPHAAIQVDSESGRRVLNVEFPGGRVKFENVSHLLNLAPGVYRFEGRERSQDVQNEIGLRWRISCIGDTSDTLGTTDFINGETPWREFDMDFVVPRDRCFYQNLVLELPARTALETEISGAISYADFRLRME